MYRIAVGEGRFIFLGTKFRDRAEVALALARTVHPSAFLEEATYGTDDSGWLYVATWTKVEDHEER